MSTQCVREADGRACGVSLQCGMIRCFVSLLACGYCLLTKSIVRCRRRPEQTLALTRAVAIILEKASWKRYTHQIQGSSEVKELVKTTAHTINDYHKLATTGMVIANS
eukprot:9467842-Pyramimonas_sp.AAC.1